MALDFPNSPTIGDEFTGGGFTWVWTGDSWGKVVAVSGGTNDFVLSVGSSGNTTYVLDRAYSAGRYSLEFLNGDTTFDIYFVGEDGAFAGYTSNQIIEASASFSEVVVIGAASNETILFTHQGASVSPSTAGDVAAAGAYLSSSSESSLPDIDDFTVLSGGNFAANVAVDFIGQNSVALPAKSVIRSSSTELLVTRPDAFSIAQSPYSIRATNPGVPAPTGTSSHILSNIINAGTSPVWVTDGNLAYNLGGNATSITLVANDTEGSDIDYSIASGSLPSGLSLDQETGVISGIFSGSASEGDNQSITFRATDAGGNFVDKAFTMVANAIPSWTTPAGALDESKITEPYSYQLVADGGTEGGALSYQIISGSLPSGLSLSSSGLISGTNSESASASNTFTIRVSDVFGTFADREFSILTTVLIVTGGTAFTSGGYRYHLFTSSGTFSLETTSALNAEVLIVSGGGGGGNLNGCYGGGGGGGGGINTYSSSLATGNYTVVVGAGGGTSTQGSASSFAALTHNGGNGASQQNGGAGGINAGGGASGGCYSNGFGGGGGPSTFSVWGVATSTGQLSGALRYFSGGGGSGSAQANAGPGGVGGGGSGGGGNPGIPSPGAVNTGGGGGGRGGEAFGSCCGAAGGSGLVIVRYPA